MALLLNNPLKVEMALKERNQIKEKTSGMPILVSVGAYSEVCVYLQNEARVGYPRSSTIKDNIEQVKDLF